MCIRDSPTPTPLTGAIGVSIQDVDGSPKAGSLTGDHEECSMSERLVVDVPAPVAAVGSLTPSRRWPRGEGVTRKPSCQCLLGSFPIEGSMFHRLFRRRRGRFECPTILSYFRRGKRERCAGWLGSKLRTLTGWLRGRNSFKLAVNSPEVS